MNIRTKLCYYDTRNPESGCFGMSEEEAEAFLSIARPDLGFIPSQLPEAP
jgi:hypothetical protein